jgi:mono/diheme cytochrome c family protein
VERKQDRTLRDHFPSILFTVVLTACLAAGTAAFILLGGYNVAADTPHTPIVYSLLAELRERSIAVRSRDVSPPHDLDQPSRVVTGAGLYAEMCSGCHLGPGVKKSELSQGLYPPAPELSKTSRLSPAQQFWIIKHGVKLTAMPAWGRTHPDPLIWDMVAFIRKLPSIPPEQYRRLIETAPQDHDEAMEHAHEH